MGASDGGEIGIAELELHCSGEQLVLAKPAADHLGKPCQHSFQRFEIGGVFVESELVTDGFCVVFPPNDAVEPSTGIETARLAGEREPPLAKVLAEEILFEPGK